MTLEVFEAKSFWLYRKLAAKSDPVRIASRPESLLVGYSHTPSNEIKFSELSANPVLDRGLFFSRLTIATPKNSIFLRWIPNSKSPDLALLCERVKAYRSEKYSQANAPLLSKLDSLYVALEVIAKSRYLRKSNVDAWLSGVSAVLQKYASLEQELLLPKFHQAAKRLEDRVASVQGFATELNKKFVAEQLDKYQLFFDTVEKSPLTDSQRRAVITDADSTLVLAGAGSGKTSVLVGKVAYLLESRRAKADEILVLAFNTKASAEIDERIRLRVASATPIKSQTFHAFGRSIVGRYRGRMPDISPEAQSEQLFGNLIEKLFVDKTESDPAYAATVLRYFVEYLYQRVFPSDFGTGEYAEALKAADLKTAKGELVKSTEERTIADFLFVHRVDYVYEAKYEFDTATEFYRQYRPDFYLPKYGIYIEHFATSKAGQPPSKWTEEEKRKYIDGIAWKRNLHKANGTRLIETYSYQQSDGVLTEMLAASLSRAGVELMPMTFRELKDSLLVQDEEYPTISRMADLITKCIRLHKAGALSEEKLRSIAAQHSDVPRAQAFLDVYKPIYEAYEADLQSKGEIDFDDMIIEANDALRSGSVSVGYKYILVDEFQDLSNLRRLLLDAIRASHPGAALYCVGDDWQSIYSFAGSDVGLTTNFCEEFVGGEIVKIDKTFRYGDSLVDITSRFVQKNPGQLKKSVKSAKGAEKYVPIKLVVYSNDPRSALSYCAKDIVSRGVSSPNVYLLGRYTHTSSPESAAALRQHTNGRASVEQMTVHRSKGLEADVVVVNEVNFAHRLGFPARIREDPLLSIFRPAAELFADAEERRLFYVALTRARESVYITAKETEISPFVHELLSDKKNASLIEVVNTDGESVAVEAPIVCASCKRGHLVLKSNSSGTSYFRCNLVPYCDGIVRSCKYCEKSPMLLTGGTLKCQSKRCGKELSLCPSCGDGYLVKRKGPYGLFIGCSNFSKKSCKHTVRSIDEGKRRGLRYLE